MGAKPKARKASTKKEVAGKDTQKAQSARFIKAATEFGVDEKEFEKALKSLTKKR